MRLILILFYLLFLLLFTKIGFSQDLFETNKYILKFESNNITLDKEIKINKIKIKSFKKILSKIVTIKDFEKINIFDISIINNFILNLKINNEKIVNNNYYSEVSLNYSKESIIDYLILNKISFVDYLPNKFLIIILEENNIKYKLLSKDNNFYKFLNINNNNLFENFFLLPALDHNDRYIFNKNNFESDNFIQNHKLNDKYKAEYQILVHSIKENNSYNNRVFLFYDNKKYEVFTSKTNKLDYKNFFNKIKIRSLDKWKNLNKIDTSIVNSLDCIIIINNIHELRYVRNKLQSNSIIKYFNLKTIKLNKNIYEIIFFGNINIFINSLEIDRMKLIIKDKSCSIELI